MDYEKITREDAIARAAALLLNASSLPEYRKNELLEAQAWLMVANTLRTYPTSSPEPPEPSTNERLTEHLIQSSFRISSSLYDLTKSVEELIEKIDSKFPTPEEGTTQP